MCSVASAYSSDETHYIKGVRVSLPCKGRLEDLRRHTAAVGEDHQPTETGLIDGSKQPPFEMRGQSIIQNTKVSNVHRGKVRCFFDF